MIQLSSRYPSDNEWDVPCLLRELQGAPVVPPVCSWGSVSRSSWMPGTWVMFVDDARFGRLLRSPLQLTASGCHAAAEPNISLYDDSPMAEAIWAIYRKRWVARSWQDVGIRVLVDLNVPERYSRMNLLGVPRGWRAYATRGYANRPDSFVAECELAQEWAGGGATVLVFGGGKRVQHACSGTPGALWFPDHMAEHRASVAASSCSVQRKELRHVKR